MVSSEPQGNIPRLLSQLAKYRVCIGGGDELLWRSGNLIVSKGEWLSCTTRYFLGE